MKKMRKTKKRSKNIKPLGIDLFAGAGGLSLGFEAAGFNIAYAIEHDKSAAKTYAKNRKRRSVHVETTDIKKITTPAVMKKLGVKKGELDIVIGGPPCQGFSTSNRQTRHIDNPNNHLVYRYVTFVKKMRPKWFLMENVSGMETFEKGAVRDDLLETFKSMGYDAVFMILNSSDFGVPQHRKRIFFIGNRVGQPMAFIEKIKRASQGKPVTIRDAISDLPHLENGHLECKMPYNGRKRKLSMYQREMRKSMNESVRNNLVTMNQELAVQRFKQIKQGENLKALARRAPRLVANYSKIENCHSWIYLRLPWSRPSVTLNNFRKNMIIHPAQHRGLSVREAARLQSFPDKYVFHGSIGSQQQQVANSVPPLLSKAIASRIAKAIRKMNRNGDSKK
jgi:DNA (cytosine-5)-methyltransferase 1